MSNGKWVMNRAGLVNFWYYTEETFQFSDGKLLLRGTNGSGKSVTMQSFLPVLLDGKKSADRLDPFGSKARKMEDYLLGEKEVVDRDERTGYLFLEYKQKGMDRYITTGIGMQARRNKGIKSWYFVVTDNRRIGGELQLTQEHLGDRVPLSQKELENRIGAGGYVVDSQQEYMELVNKYVFGFSSSEAYEDLIKLLIQLRSPKLSKDFKPTVIYEILESALPPLTDDELRHLSDTIESLDQTQQQMEQLEREYSSIQRLVKQYDAYNQYVLAERADGWQKAIEKYNAAVEQAGRRQQQERELAAAIARLEIEKQSCLAEKVLAEEQKERLQKHEVWDLEGERKKKEERLQELARQVQSIQSKWDKKHGQYKEALQKQQKAEEQLTEAERKQEELLDELAYRAEEADFSQHEVNLADFTRQGKQVFHFSVWQKEAREHEQRLAVLRQLIEQRGRAQAEYSRVQADVSGKKGEVDKLKQELQHLDGWFTEQRQQLEQQVFAWIKQHPSLSFSSTQLQHIARSLEGLYEENSYEEVRDILVGAIQDYVLRVEAELQGINGRIQGKKQELQAAGEELQHWKTLKLSNPERAAATEVSRRQLMEKGRAYLPFYAAVEFRAHVKEEQRNRLEAVLKQVGILDSLLVDHPLVPLHDRLIQPDPVAFGYTLADYLEPDVDENSTIPAALVDEVLRSVPVDQDGRSFRIDADGTYAIGCMVGHAPEEGAAKYIGRSSRKRHQLEMIQECEARMERLQADKLLLQQQAEACQKELEQTAEWRKAIPGDKDLLSIDREIVQTKDRLTQREADLAKLEEQWKRIYEQLQKLQLDIHQQGSSLGLELTAEVLGQAAEAMREYQDELHELQRTVQAYVHVRERIQQLREGTRELEEELDEMKGEQNSREAELEKEKGNLAAIEQQLKLKGVEEIRLQIREVQNRLQQAASRIDEITGELPQKKADHRTCQEKLESLETQVSFWRNMAGQWEQMVQREAARGFVAVGELNPDMVTAQFGGMLTKHDRSKLQEQLTKTFLQEQPSLTEYRMFEHSEDFEQPDWFSQEWDEALRPFISEWKQFRSRRLIQMEYKGQRVTPYLVAKSLQQELEEQKSWFDEQDRQLYEDIMVNTVGVILRRRIQRAEKWVRDMDKIMASRNSSSGLTFSIAWKPRTAEAEQELDTKELVQLLQRNSKFLQEEDLNRITKHFQSRITKAKEFIQLRNEGTTLHQVLKEVLDYRKWFSFVLSYKRVNEPKRELTNNAFFKFSGGEKAMAMYIPLFTAAYSRYQEAADMAPYIITLDEAFAGVDENNIRDMFEVVEELQFDYMMNSQALWGDYDTISSLAIYELVRPKNADFVTVIPYYWNGKRRGFVADMAQMEELAAHE
ncbi:TIGR02680 family protein [Ectobacillus ponti]|uniref:TIGR02680 family protein n=1 Tax=Ectobacillus ponti TaxID=2961894 RepID=A0AA42BQF7_9BACI|nr:TIGR02680 family protein [Ectobacillus ponti]MCP8969356.1 TIGR02680 family protein [Ectobacillus ponti]